MTTHGSSKAVVEIRRAVDEFAEAVRRKDIEKIMSNYALDVTTFDIVPPLQVRGSAAYRENWEEWFHSTEGPIGYEIHDLSITANEDVAFCHSVNHATSTMKKDGKAMDAWIRVTVGFRKVNGRWLVTHEHISAPIDMETEKALFDLEP